MLILLRKGSEIGLHRHPLYKAEAYVVLEGLLGVTYQEDSGRSRIERFAPWGNTLGLPSVSLHRNGVWHEPFSISDEVVYLEFYNGPFVKEEDVEYFTKSN
jgi:glucose-6-phosphate isomerase